jgi:hypothetical protein
VFHCHYVVLDLSGIINIVGFWCLSRFEAQQLAHIGLGALDAGTEHRLEPQVRSDEEVWIGNQAADPAQAMYCASRFVKQRDGLLGQLKATR